MMRCAASTIDCSPEEQKRLMEIPAVVTGHPARSPTWRATFMPAAPSRKVAPTMTSSTSAGSMRARSMAWRNTWPVKVTGWVMLSEPRQDFASPVRAVETTTASVMVDYLKLAKLRFSRANLFKSGAGAQDVRQSDGVGVVKRAAPEIRKSIAREVHHVDVRGAQRDAFLQNARTFVDQRIQRPLDDFLVTDLAALPQTGRFFQNDLRHELGWIRAAVARFVIVPAGAGFLAETLQFANAIRNLRIHAFGMFEVQPLADGPADVVAGEVAHPKRTHRESKFLERPVDLLRQRARIEQQAHLTQIRIQHAVADESVADPGDDADFLDLLRDVHAGRDHVLGGLGAAHDFQEFGDIRGAEEMQPHHILRPAREIRDLVQIQGRGVGGEDCPRLRLLIEPLEHLLLHLQVLEHGLDDQIRVRDVIVGQRARDPFEPSVEFLAREPPLLQGALVISHHHAQALVESRLSGLEHRD